MTHGLGHSFVYASAQPEAYFFNLPAEKLSANRFHAVDF